MLIITEKPSVARQFAQALKADAKEPFIFRNKAGAVTITHCRGHLLEAWEPVEYDERFGKWDMSTLPIVPADFKYKPIKDSKKILVAVTKLIKEAMKGNEEIVVATDAGREGEVIARLVLSYAGADTYERKSRFWVSESTAEPKVVHEGLKERFVLKKYDGLARTGLIWKKCDWIYGMNMTRLFSLLAQSSGLRGKESTMNTGRVQTAVLYEVFRREKEIENFKSEKYEEFEIVTNGGVTAKLVKSGGKDTRFEDGSKYIEDAEKALVKNKAVLVKDVQEKSEVTESPLLYNTSDLQKDAYRVYGFNPDKTLSLMQTLYEEKGTLSYPRTPSRVLGEGNEALAQEWLQAQLVHEKELSKVIRKEKYTVANKRLFNNAKLEDHYGLVPLKYMEDDGSDAYKVWRLVQVRFLMQGMDPFVRQKTEVTLEKVPYVFVGTRSVVTDVGWKRIEIKKTAKSGEEEEEDDDVKEPGKPVRKGMVQEVVSWQVEKKKTKPPSLYNYATLLAFMQNPRGEKEGKKLVGIGTEATRAAHIKGLEKHLLMVNRKGLRSTDKGKTLLGMISRIGALKDNIQAKETTAWEEIGETRPEELYQKTVQLVRDVVKGVEIPKGGGGTAGRESLGKCPKCGRNVYEGNKVYFCEGFKEKKCDVTIWKKTEGIVIMKGMIRTLLEGKEIQHLKCEGKGKRKYEGSFRLDKDGNLVIKEKGYRNGKV